MTDRVIDEELQAMKDDLADLRRDLKALLRATRTESSSRLHDLGDRLRGFTEEGAARLRHGVDHARGYGRVASEQAHKTVADHPLVTMLTAVGVGMALGRLVGRRR